MSASSASTSPVSSTREPVKAVRNKKPHSCTECRRRKKLCDRRVPGCNQCVSRGTVSLCRWGDERDAQPARARDAQRALHSSRPSSHASPSQSVLDNEQSLMYELSRGEITAHQGELSSLRSASPPQTSRNTNGPDRHLTFAHAKILVDLFFSTDMFSGMVDEQLVFDTLAGAMAADSPYAGGRLVELRADKPDVYALILYLCSSALFLMPQTYAITLGLVEQGDEVIELVGFLDKEAQRALSSMKKATIEMVQARMLFQLNLAHRVDLRDHVETMDSIIRTARCLGLDRLGTVEQDEAMWRAMDLQGETPGSVDWHSAALPAMRTERSWAATTLLRRDRRARNLGRLHWLFLRGKDWALAQMLGSYTVYKGSYTTGLPRVYKEPSTDNFSEMQQTMYSIADVGLEAFRRFADICADAETQGRTIDYSAILELDSEIMATLASLPDWLQVDKVPRSREMAKARMGAVMVCSTLWHRLFMIHRPFLLLSRTQPERYGLSSSRSWDYAMMCIKLMQGSDDNLMMKNIGVVFRMIQAALVLISHLFLKSVQLDMAEVVEVHEQIQFVVTTVKHVESLCDPRSVFAGQGRRLEAVLVAASKIKSGVTPPLSLSLDHGRFAAQQTPSSHMPSVARSCLDTALDEHLMRLLFECDAPVLDPEHSQNAAARAGSVFASGDVFWDELLNLVDGAAPR